MDQNMLGAWLLTYIENNFPGGTAKFTREGGMVIGLTDGSVIIFHPEMPESFANKIKMALEGKRDVTCTSDFEVIVNIMKKLSRVSNSEVLPSPPVIKMEPERRLITDDDVTNIKIAAGMGVDEFINNM